MAYRQCLLAIIVFAYIVYSPGLEWRKDRRPKIMGDLVPRKSVLPGRGVVQKRIVKFHNHFRTKVSPRAANMLRMKWHKGAAKAAQKWADQCMFLTHDNLTGRHIHGFGACGQNIFVATKLVPWLFAIKTWFLEKDNFTYGSAKNDLKVVGHYTQMVWAATHQVGCGLTKCNKYGNTQGKTYFNYVCNYCPIGNRETKLGRPYRKGKPCRGCPKSCHAKSLCTNGCHAADLWINCKELHKTWPHWLCRTETPKGLIRKDSCAATCQCKGKIHD